MALLGGNIGKIYKNQTALTLLFDTGLTTEQAATVQTAIVKYRKPSKSTGQWSANMDGTDVSRDVTSGDLDESGPWVFWVDLIFNDATWAPGEPVTETVYEVGK